MARSDKERMDVGGEIGALTAGMRAPCMSVQSRTVFAMVTPSAKTRRIEVRMTDEERELEQAAATARGQTLSEFVRQAARREAEQVLAERTSIVLDSEEAARFLAALDDPASFEQGLSALTERPSVLDD